MYRHNPKYTEANDGIAFATTGNTEDMEKKNKKDKKKNITCFKCKKNGHYSNECPDDNEKNKSGSSFLVHNTQESSDDETDLTISHDHIAAVQGGDSDDQESAEDTDRGDTYDGELETEDPTADLHLHKKMYYALCRTRPVFQAAGSY